MLKANQEAIVITERCKKKKKKEHLGLNQGGGSGNGKEGGVDMNIHAKHGLQEKEEKEIDMTPRTAAWVAGKMVEA